MFEPWQDRFLKHRNCSRGYHSDNRAAVAERSTRPQTLPPICGLIMNAGEFAKKAIRLPCNATL